MINYMTGEDYPNLENEGIEHHKKRIAKIYGDDDISSYMLFESIKNHLKLKNLSAEDYQERIKKIADALDIL
jgi:hypothetical protein